MEFYQCLKCQSSGEQGICYEAQHLLNALSNYTTNLGIMHTLAAQIHHVSSRKLEHKRKANCVSIRCLSSRLAYSMKTK